MPKMQEQFPALAKDPLYGLLETLVVLILKTLLETFKARKRVMPIS